MRGRKALINTAVNLFEELVAVICGFILPRLILTAFGSRYNGLTTSITQFLSCAVLLRSGIGGATRAALYKPIAENNNEELSAIVKATDIFMKKIGLILGGSIIAFAAIYPFFVKNEFEWFFTFSLFVIIGASTFAESFFGITYLIVLQADQRVWVSSLLKSICYVANTIICAVLIYAGATIHIVKLGSATVYVLYPIILGAYVRRKYRIKKNVKPNMLAISQRWDSFWHQIATFVMNNTDVMVLTVFTNMLEVSVYSIYNMVISSLKRLIGSVSSGIEAAFGNMIAKKEDEILAHNLSVFEFMIFSLATVVYTTAALLILSFVSIYTRGVNDVNYIRPAFAYIILFAQFFNAIRLPYQLVVQAAGHYKATKKGAIVEPIINIVLSIALVIKFGLVGVAVGTLAATIFRTVQYSLYMSSNLVKRSWFITPSRCIIAFVETGLAVLLVYFLNLSEPGTYLEWLLNAVVIFAIVCAIVSGLGFVFFRKDMTDTVKKLKYALANQKTSG